jgi:cytochrome b561
MLGYQKAESVRAAAIGHLLLYALAISTVLPGIANASMRGDHLFSLRHPILGQS